MKAPFGTWPSPVTASLLVEASALPAYPCESGGRVFWQERRPSEGGRVAIVSQPSAGGPVADVLPKEMSARTLANEYGGRAWAVGPGGQPLVFSNFADQRLWLVGPEPRPRPLTPAPSVPGSVRFACPALHPGGRWVVAVRERHLGARTVNDLVAISLPTSGEPEEPAILAEGRDFYASPEFSPDGSGLAFVVWDHPNMPWDSTELWRGRFAGGKLEGLTPVAGQGGGESVLQPKWVRATGELVYISDRTGWWNLYAGATPLAAMEADFAGPAWAFGESDYVLLPGGEAVPSSEAAHSVRAVAEGEVVAAWVSRGQGHIGVVRRGKAEPFDLPYSSFSHLAPGPGGSVLAIAAGPLRAPELLSITLDGTFQVLRPGAPSMLAPEWVSVGQHFSFPTSDGEEAYATYYEPKNPEVPGPREEAPPLIVTSHGGPTGSASRALELRKQYWTTRGFAVVDVDYRGSTGYGRAYREAIYGKWGAIDVSDCIAAVTHLTRRGLADPAKVVIRGTSASGLTALAALAGSQRFACAAVFYPVCDLATLLSTAHNFERSYMRRLVPPAEAASRSPLSLAQHIKAPVLIVHGVEDTVVPVSQARDMARAIRENGGRPYFVEVEGEGHGFRNAATVVRAQEVELAFYAEVLGFEPPGDLAEARSDLRAAGRPEGATWRAGPRI